MHTHGPYSLDQYANRSPLRSIAPSLKIGGVLVSLCLLIGIGNVWTCLFVLLTMGSLVVCKGKVPVQTYLALYLIPGGFILCSTLAIAVNLSFHPLQLWMTKESVLEALYTAGKALGGISILYTLSLTTPIGEIVGVLKKLHCPNLLMELMYLIYRFIFLLLELHKQMWAAARSRLGDVDMKTSIRSFAQIMGNLLIVSIQKAGKFYDAMEARGYEGELKFYWEDKKVTKGQLACILLYEMCIVGISIMR